MIFYLNNISEHIYVLYCGHGSMEKWNIGITRNQLIDSKKRLKIKLILSLIVVLVTA